MEMQYLFYGVAVFFFMVTVGYFVGNYLDEIPGSIKAVLSFVTAAFLFVLGDYLRRFNK